MTNKELWQKAVELVGEEELSRRFTSWVLALIRKAQQKSQNKGSSELFLEEAGKIIGHLNKLSNRRHTLTDSAKALIRARMNEGFTIVDFLRVHEAMCKKWLGDEVMDANLRPSTLYRPSHFSEYLALWTPPPPPPPPKATITEVMPPEKRQAVIDRVKSKKWYEHVTWSEFYKWTFQLPDPEALLEYEMPERIRRMRCANLMSVYVMGNQHEKYAWAEREYQEIKRKHESTRG